MIKRIIQCFSALFAGILLAFVFLGCTVSSDVLSSNSDPYVASESTELLTLETAKRPWIKTKIVLWQEFYCLIPGDFEIVSEGSETLMAVDDSRETDSGLGYIAYFVRPESELKGWNVNPFSEKHIQLLLSLFVEDKNASAMVQADKSYSLQMGEDVVCYHLCLEDTGAHVTWYCVSKFRIDNSNALVLAGVASDYEGVQMFDRLVETAAAVDHKADMTDYIPKITITRFNQTDRSPLLYGIYETDSVYVHIEDPEISRDISDYTIFGQSKDGKITLYISKADDTFMLIDDPEYEEAVLTAKSGSSYFTHAD